MRLTLATLLLMAASPAWAGDLLVNDRPAGDAAAASPVAAPAQAAPAPPVPHAAIYDAPLFGRAAPAAAKVDETALRFYAAQKNRARVEAEIRRLHALYPAWKAPANLYATGTGNDEQPLWDLFAAGRSDELRVAIQAREKREPGWRPSADLVAKMARQETAAAIKALAEAKDWERLLALADAHPDVLGCGTVDLDWRVADAFAGTGAPERAYEVDAAILKSCRDRDERLATVRKAVEMLPGAAVEQLIAAGQTLADGSGEFDEVRLDLARRQIGAALASTDGPDVPAQNLDALGAATLRGGDPADAALLGWYLYGRKRPGEADGWFKLGLAGSAGDPKMAEGHALALRDLGRLAEAGQIAHAWRERSATLRALFVTLTTARLGGPEANTVDPAEMADFTAILVADRSVAAAGALGWAAYGRQDFDAAALWFGRAVDWTGTGELPDKVAEGYGLTLKGLGRFAAAEDLLYGRRERSTAARDLYVSVAVAALSGGGATGAFGPDLPAAPISPERMDRFAEVIRTARSVAGAGALGWRNLRDGRPAAAVDWFREAARWSPDGAGDIKTVEGLVLALKGSGDLAEAEDAAYARIADSAQLREAYRGIVTAELTTPALADRLSADSVRRFAALVEGESSSDGAEALGWYRLGQDAAGQERCGYGLDWFRRAIAWSPDHAGTAKGNEGYALALGRAGHAVEAAEVALAWADRAPDMRALAIKVMVEALTRDLFAPRLGEERLERLAALVRDEHSVSGAQALAWARYRDAGMGYGVGWFEEAIRWSPDRQADAKTVEGYASALRDVGRLADAEEALFPWADRVPLMRDLYIDTVVSELTLDNPPEPMPHDRLARFIAVATPLRSAAAAQALGWYRFARREYAEAAIWFKYAVDWWPALPADADRFSYVPEGYRPQLAHLALKPEDYRRSPRAFTSRAHDGDAAQHRYVDTFGGLATTWTGYALALRAVGRTPEAEDVAFAWRDRWPALGRFFVDLAVEALTKPGAAGAIAPERLKRFAAVIEEEHHSAGAAALGWAAASRHDPAEAAVWFKAATDWRAADSAPDPTVMGAYVDALRGAGRVEEAFAVASAWVGTIPALAGERLDAALDMLAAAGRTARAARAGDGAKAGADAAPPLAPERLAEAASLAKADGSARSASALGWYALDIGQPAAALPAFKLAITRLDDTKPAAPSPDALAGGASPAAAGDDLPKAVEGYTLALRALGRDADALTLLEAWGARLPALQPLAGDVVADLLSRDGGKAAVAPDLLDRMTAAATRTRSVPAAAAFGWYSYGRRDWARAGDWFASAIAWSPDGRGPVKLAEGYAASLHNQCRFGEAEAAAVSRMDEGDGEALRRIYVDSLADRLSRARAGAALPAAEAAGLAADAAHLAAATATSSSANGAQALGWYAYRSRQFAAAGAWFEKAVAWRVTEAEVYGLALSYRRAGDAANLSRILSAYGDRYASLGAVRRAGIGGHEPPVPDFGDLARRGCAGGDPLAGADAAPRPVASIPSAGRPAFVATVEGAAGLPGTAAAAGVPAPAPVPSATVAPAAVEAPAERLRPAPVGPAAPRRHPAAVASLARAPGDDGAPAAPKRAEATSGEGGSARAAAALAAKDYAGCLAILARRAGLGGADRATEGWCLLGLGRSAEAGEAFRAARAGGGRVASDGALGETLSHLRDGDTAAALESAAHTRLGAEPRRALGVQILAQQAYDAFKAGRFGETIDLLRRRAAFAAETRDLVMLRGWAHYRGGDYDAARRAFAQADAQLSDGESRGALATVADALTPKALR